MSRFLEALRSGRVLLMDGAMGTELIRLGLQPGENSATWNVLHPERVRAVHQAYVDSGAEVLLTNTFQSNPIALAEHGLEQQLESINQNAVALARSVAGPDRFVLGDVGPLLRSLWDVNASTVGPIPMLSLIPEMLARIVRSLRGADALLCETWSGRSLEAMRDQLAPVIFYGMPVLISLTYSCLVPNTPPFGEVGNVFRLRGVESPPPLSCSAIGVNCGREISIGDITDIVRCHRQETDLPLFARPNAGTPVKDGDQWRYPHTPAIMAERLPELLEAGVSMVGGCCGTSPEHIAAFRPIVDAWNARRPSS